MGDGTTPPVAGGDAPKPADKPSSAPESYTPWKVPEGYELDAGLNEEASPIFKELGLSQDQAQKLVDFYAKHSISSGKEAFDAWITQRQDWRESMKSDPELSKYIGKDGNFGPDSPLVRTVNSALNGLQNPKLVSDFKAAMELTGAGDNPAFVQVLHALASKVTEGTAHVQGTPLNSGAKRPSAGAALYPNLPSTSG